jgi:hypothetical protein
MIVQITTTPDPNLQSLPPKTQKELRSLPPLKLKNESANALANLTLQHRKFAKIVNTYVKPLGFYASIPSHTEFHERGNNRVVRATWLQTGTGLVFMM